MIKTVVKDRGSTNDISNKYNTNSFYYSTETTHKGGSNRTIYH